MKLSMLAFVGCFIGSVPFTSTIGNGANYLGINSFWWMVIEGPLIPGVVYLDNMQKRRALARGQGRGPLSNQ